MLPLFTLNAIVMMLAALALWLIPAFSGFPSLVHVAFALGIMPLILAAIVYFVPVLVRGSGAPRWMRALPLFAWMGAAVMLAGFSGTLGLTSASHGAVILSGTTGMVILLWMRQRSRSMLGSPHPCFAWYFAALVFLATALWIVPAIITVRLNERATR